MNRLVVFVALAIALIGTASASGVIRNAGPDGKNQKVVAGMVNSDGSILRGRGFTVQHITTGEYEIDFTENQFTGKCPIMVATGVGGSLYAPVPTVYVPKCGNTGYVFLWHAGENIKEDYPFVFLARDTD